MSITFEPSLPKTRGVATRYPHEEWAEAMRQNPGEWALLPGPSNASAIGNIQQTIVQGFAMAYRPAGSFEAARRTVDGELRLYARYVGGNDGT